MEYIPEVPDQYKRDFSMMKKKIVPGAQEMTKKVGEGIVGLYNLGTNLGSNIGTGISNNMPANLNMFQAQQNDGQNAQQQFAE